MQKAKSARPPLALGVDISAGGEEHVDHGTLRALFRAGESKGPIGPLTTVFKSGSWSRREREAFFDIIGLDEFHEPSMAGRIWCLAGHHRGFFLLNQSERRREASQSRGRTGRDRRGIWKSAPPVAGSESAVEEFSPKSAKVLGPTGPEDVPGDAIGHSVPDREE